jgi:AraC family transcriptional regulator
MVAEGNLGGQATRKVSCRSFIFTDVVYPPGFALPWHAHERASIQFILEGSNSESLGIGERHCKRFDMTYKPAGERHRNNYGLAGARCLIIEMPQTWLDGLRDIAPIPDVPKFVGAGALAGVAARIEREVMVADPFTPLVLDGLMLELLASAARARHAVPVNVPRWLERARELLHARFNCEIELNAIAAEVGVHPVHVASVFRRVYGYTPGEYVRRLRIAEARQQLLESDRPICQISVDCGFYDQSHLTKTFKRYTGLTPQQYRAGSTCGTCDSGDESLSS